MHWGSKFRYLAGVGLAGIAMLWSLPSEGQVAWGDLHATANGQLESLYGGNFGNLLGDDSHSLGFAGRGIINGDYYNPNFLSFSVLPYYGRSQDNSDSQSITDASGYTGTVGLFKGSRFPGFVNVEQTWNNSGTFGIPGVTGLTTTNNNHGVNIGWSALLPNLPTLSVGFGDTGGASALLGSDSTTTSATRNFNLGSSYNLAGYYLTGGFIHLNTSVGIDGLEDGASESVSSSSNQYRLGAQGPIPYRQSNMAVNFNRSSYNSNDSLNGTNYGTTDTINGSANMRFPKAPVTLSAIYTDNILGNYEQQLVSNGQTPLAGLNAPASHSLTLEASTFVNVMPRLLVGGYVERTQQFFAGQNFGLTQAGLTVNYNFFQKLKGLTVYAGLLDSATQAGNTRIGFIGNVSYNRSVGKWEINSFVRYDQDVQTLLVQYTESTLNYGATIKREINPDLRWVGVANVVRSVFEQTAGNANSGESFTTMVIWKKASLSGIYTKSEGTSILTATGLVATPVPAQALGLGNTIFFNGSSYGANVSIYPTRNLNVSTAWSKALSDTTSPQLLSNNGSTNYYGLLTYQFRKLLFSAGVTKFNQSISTSGLPPTMLTSYSFGVSRWFKGF